MKSSHALLIRSLISKLHPPSPATPRESQQLLRMLDDAFRKRLDEAHPAPNPIHQIEQTDGPIHGRRSASSHLDSLLHHPLLETKATDNIKFTQTPGGTRAVAVFERLLREGTLTIATLQQCASNYSAERKAAISASTPQMAPKLAAWFDSAAQNQQAEFFGNPAAMEAVLSVMFADNSEETVWTWLRVLYEGAWQNSTLYKAQQLNAEDLFVSQLMHCAIQKGAATSAIQQFIVANQYRLNSGRAEVRSAAKHDTPPYSPMVHSWNRLASYVLMKRNKHGIDEASYDAMVQYAPSTERKMYLTAGFMAVYHPTSPSASQLYQEFQSHGVVSRWAKWKWKKSARLQRALLTTILDTAELSLAQDRKWEANFFLEFAQTHFADIVSKSNTSAAPVTRLENAREELETYTLNLVWVDPTGGRLHTAVG